MSRRVLFLVGPTGSGKSKLALHLAKKLNGEIISCDSMLIYRGMDIGTDKPTPKEQKLVPHHLLDLRSPRAECSVFKHREMALKAMDQIFAKKRLPIIVGGSGFYFKTLVDGLTPQSGKQAQFRNKLEALACQKGLSYLYGRLKKIDSERASKIHPNDKRRIIRALEILKSSEKIKNNLVGGFDSRGIRWIAFGLSRDRVELYQGIGQRVDRMFESGWINEVKRLKRMGLSKTARAAIGYTEILNYLDGKQTLEKAKSAIKKRTRHLAKKQMTWFRRDKRIRWIPIAGDKFVSPSARHILKHVRNSFATSVILRPSGRRMTSKVKH